MTCIDCGAEVIGGQPLHASTVYFNNKVTVEYRCEQCAVEYAQALWPDDWGPYPKSIHKEGTA
jgi:DNA-directed RNA polymerase subunit RPC12/RpoP